MEYYVVNNTPTVAATYCISHIHYFTHRFIQHFKEHILKSNYLFKLPGFLSYSHATTRLTFTVTCVFCLMRFFPISNIPPTVLNSILQSLISTGRTIEPLS